MSEPWSLVTAIRGPRLFGQDGVDRHLTLTAGQPLLLVREPTNPVDPENAVIVMDLFGAPVGYIQRPECATVARLMDKGVTLMAAVQKAPRRFHGKFRVADARIWRDDAAGATETDAAPSLDVARVPELA